MLRLFSRSSVVVLAASFMLLTISAADAAQVENLRHQSLSVLRGLTQPLAPAAAARPQISMQESSHEIDNKNNTVHYRLQETYAGHPVWGAEVAVHLPQSGKGLKALSWRNLPAVMPAGTMNGVIYKDLDKDLQSTPASVFEEARAQRALSQAISHYQDQAGRSGDISDKQASLVVYVDNQQKAHWAYYLEFKHKAVKGMPAKPRYLMDAMSFEIYQQWDEVQTASETSAGGYGGNPKIGKLIYDGLKGDLPSLSIRRDEIRNTCYMENQDVVVHDVRKNEMTEEFFCKMASSQHNGVYWHGSLDSVNGSYSPAMDALYIGKMVKEMYRDWYGIPVLVSRGQPMTLLMRVHLDDENAYWDGESMTFGDGGYRFYPLVSLGVGAHEISHGFTQQHSNLVYSLQPGGLNESFSDMAAQAAEYYAYGKSSWLIGADVSKAPGDTLRYMEHPALDCVNSRPGHCSIEHMKDYTDDLNVHYTSGIFNRVFFLIANAAGWDTRKAFDVMVQANRFYWTKKVTFAEAACGVKDAAKDYGYSQDALVTAFTAVGLDSSKC